MTRSENAALRVLTELVDAEQLEVASRRGLEGLAFRLAHRVRTRGPQPQDPGAVGVIADWLIEQVEVTDLFADDDTLGAVLRAHWEPDLEPPDVGPAAPLEAHVDLEAALRADPEDDGLWAVYGDWLLERGEVLGELGALLRREEAATDDAAQRRAERARKRFEREHRDALWGRLYDSRRILRPTWRYGFIRGAHLETSPRGKKDFQGAVLLRLLFDLPAARFLSRLTLGPFDHARADQYAEMMGVLLEADRPALRHLDVGRYAAGGYESGDLGDVSPLPLRAPALRRLGLASCYGHVGPLAFPHLASLRLEGRLAREVLAEASSSTELPALRSLTVRDPRTGLSEPPWPGLIQLLEDCPVRHLTLELPRIDVVSLVEGLQRRPALESLDLRGSGELEERDLRLLQRRFPAVEAIAHD